MYAWKQSWCAVAASCLMQRRSDRTDVQSATCPCIMLSNGLRCARTASAAKICLWWHDWFAPTPVGPLNTRCLSQQQLPSGYTYPSLHPKFAPLHPAPFETRSISTSRKYVSVSYCRSWTVSRKYNEWRNRYACCEMLWNVGNAMKYYEGQKCYEYHEMPWNAMKCPEIVRMENMLWTLKKCYEVPCNAMKCIECHEMLCILWIAMSWNEMLWMVKMPWIAINCNEILWMAKMLWISKKCNENYDGRSHVVLEDLSMVLKINVAF